MTHVTCGAAPILDGMTDAPLVLGIETSCDETGVALVRAHADRSELLADVVASSMDEHARFGGIIPEIASRAHLEAMVPTIERALATAGVGLADVDAIAVTAGPGLVGPLTVGASAAKALALGLGKPLIGVDHVHAHLYSVMLDPPPSNAPQTTSNPLFPAVGLVVSGGHTALYEIRSFTDITLIGSTIDDAIGEAYDKVAAILNLPYPGGPPIDKLAATGNPAAVQFPRTLLDKDSLDFSFSGLKTAVLYHVKGVPQRKRPDLPPLPQPPLPEMTPAHLADVCASFQQACADIVVEKVRRAIRRVGAKSVLTGGGVSLGGGGDSTSTVVTRSIAFLIDE